VDGAAFTVDAEALRAAAEKFEVWWPSGRGQAHAAIQPAPLDVPSGRWFARVLPAMNSDEAICFRVHQVAQPDDFAQSAHSGHPGVDHTLAR
jgi:hypothetical protein